MGKAEGAATRVMLSGRPGDDVCGAAEKRRMVGVVAVVEARRGALVATPLARVRMVAAFMVMM